MKNLIVYLAFIALLFSCKKEEATEEVNPPIKYQLTEILVDPGDGSGTFQPVSSSKVIEFHSNGKVTSNGDVCDLSITANSPFTGSYSFADSSISSANCTLNFDISSNVLIIHYPCIEPCMGKYEKL